MGTYFHPATYRVAVVVLLLVAAPAAGPLADTARGAAGDDQTFAVAQGGSCYAVPTYENETRNVTTFYDYRNPYPSITGRPAASTFSSYGTDQFQANGRSALLFYAGPDDTSMVIVHGRRGDGIGGSTTRYTISGLPSGSWAVRDDEYPNQDDEWQIGGTTAMIDWKWAANRTDGGAYRGFDSLSDTVVIDPQYNEEAPSWGDWGYSGEDEHLISDWIVYGEDGGEHSLALDRRVFVHAGGCVDAEVTASLQPPSDASAGEPVTLDASDSTVAGDAGGYEWDFDGDGEVDAVTREPSVSHTFEEEREYTVRVTPFDTYGNTDTASTTFVVGNPSAPDAALTASPSTATVNQTVTLDASDSTDNGTIVRYEWDVDGDGTIDANTTEPTVETTFESAGERQVSVTAIDGTNETGTASVNVEVTPDQPPSASLTGPSDVAVGEEVTLDAGESTDDRGIVRYEWDVDGDGTIDANTTEPTYSFAYEEAGTVDASVTAVDGEGQTGTTSATVRVGVTAALSAPTDTLVTQTITLDASESTIDGEGVTYRWDVDGDGTVDVNTTEPTYSFAYDNTGEYTPRVVVTDGANITDEATATVAVEARAALSVPETVSVGESVTLDAGGGAVGGSNVTYEWDVDGDGEFENETAAATFTHTYDRGGSYSPAVRVSNDAGTTRTASATVTVESGAALSAPEAALVDEQIALDASDTRIGGANVTYEWDVDGDGTIDANTTDPTFAHAYNETGTYAPTVRVTSDAGETLTASVNVSVDEPEPSIDADATDVEADSSVTFNGDAGAGGDSSVSYRWEFGDGATASGQSVQHAYAGSGQYTVTLSVLLGGSAVASTDLPINVTDAPEDPDGGDSGGPSGGNSGGPSGGNSGGPSGGNSGGPSGGNSGGSSDGPSGSSNGGSSDSDGASEPPADLEPNYTSVTGTVSDTRLVTGDTLVTTASVRNVGNGSGTKTIEFEIDGEQVDSRQFTLEPNQSRTVRFTWAFDEPGVHSVEIDRNERFLVNVTPPQPNVSVAELDASATEIGTGDEITFTAMVRNDGRAAGTTTVALRLFNETVATENVTVQPGTATRVSFTRRILAAGEYNATVGNRTVVVAVRSTSAATERDGTATGSSTLTNAPGFGPLAATAAIAGAAALLALRRRRTRQR